MTSNRLRDTLLRIGAIREDRLEGCVTRTRDADPPLGEIAGTNRRFADHRQFFTGRDTCDFACRAGSFPKVASPLAASGHRAEQQDNRRAALNAAGTPAAVART
ncbi:hypothetical protein LC092_18580 [Stappia stellulata]|uniref:hypothetical protein n=1 Tax=Stappia stellulata TaxID=71235 RepID=UPI001CD5F3F5|nr:hypothetical protein [Stappia stellulata]MCA1244457.1 hypothetical protein [Stappia stellulata]